SASVRFSPGLLFSAARCSSARANCAVADWRFSDAVAAASAFVFAGAAETKNSAALSAAKTGERRVNLIREFFPAKNICPHPPKRHGRKTATHFRKNQKPKKSNFRGANFALPENQKSCQLRAALSKIGRAHV